MRNIFTLGNPNPNYFQSEVMAIHLELRRGRSKHCKKIPTYGHFDRDDLDFTFLKPSWSLFIESHPLYSSLTVSLDFIIT